MKKLIMFLMLILMFAIVGYAALPVQDDFNTGGIPASPTTIAAGAWTLVVGSTAQTTDSNGNKINTRAYQIAVVDSSLVPVNFWYAYAAVPGTAYFPWLQSLWGPLQTKQLPPTTGIYIYSGVTYTATAFIDRKY